MTHTITKRVLIHPTLDELRAKTEQELFDIMLSTRMIHTGPKPDKEGMLMWFERQIKFDHPIFEYQPY